MLFSIGLWLGGLPAVFGFVLSGKFGLLLGVADKALRVGPLVLLAPIPFGFEIANERHVATRTDFLRDAVLVAPPAVMIEAIGRDRGRWRIAGTRFRASEY
jgi:hypothetical protein